MAETRFVNGDTDSTEGPGFPMRLTVEVEGSAFTYAVAFDDDLAALDWALLGLGEEEEVDVDILRASLRKGWEKRTDHSRLWRGDGVFPMLQNYAESVASLPESRLTFRADPPYEVRLSYQDNFVRMSTSEHDTVNVEFMGLPVLLECPVWVRGLNSWVDDFFRRLRTEDLWLVRTMLLGIPVRKDFLFEEDLPALRTWGLVTKSSQLFLPAVHKERSNP
ncbi:hypothetical protein [Arthrobacter sp. NPDC057013]|uniref:hypothetical protein n=1 Tax=Arthrobacter sp. NPDC057013 TaxID=3345999 RepID=UPI003638CBE0